MKAPVLFALLALSLVLSGTSCAQSKEERKKDETVTAGSTRPGWLGVSISDMTSRLARKMNVKTEDGALVDDVGEDSPAEKAGVKEGDVIVEFNGKAVNDAGDLRRFVRRAAPGASVNIVIMRKDEKKTLQATLGKAPRDRFAVAAPIPPVMPHVRVLQGSSLDGMNLSDLNRQLGEYFEAPNGKGVLVEEVDKDSKAEKAGFKAGDVIVKVGKELVEDTGDIHEALQDAKKGDKADFEVIRKGARKTLTLEIDHDGFGYRFRSFSPPHRLELLEEEFNPEQFELQLRKSGDVLLRQKTLQRSLEGLKEEMKTIGKKVRQEMLELKEKLRNELHSSWS